MLDGCPQNAVVAYDFFVGKGLSTIQAAAIVGNLQVESPGVNPRLSAPEKKGGVGRGIAMWQDPGRWQDLLAFAAQSNRDPLSLDTQLNFVWYELPSHGLDQLRASNSIEDAVLIFQKRFENPDPAYAHTDVRIKHASEILECASLRPPEPNPMNGTARGGGSRFLTAFLSVLGVSAVGFGLYKLIDRAQPEPQPFRPRPRPVPPERHPYIDYRNRL